MMRRMFLRWLPVLLAAFLLQDEAGLLAELKNARDEADPAKIEALAGLRTRDAAEGLLELYEVVGSIYMKREILRALPTFDGASEAEELALQKLADVATGANERELRLAAIESLGRCAHLGRSFLARIVESTAQDELREAAMDRHVALSETEDLDWYRKIFQTLAVPQEGEAKEKKAERKKKEESEEPPERKQFNLDSLREKAFGRIAEQLTDDEVIAARIDTHPPIRRMALEELHRRGWKGIEETARGVFEYIDESPQNRAHAAELLVRLNGAEEAPEFIETGQKFATPEFLRRRLAELVAGMHDPQTDKKVARLLGKGKPYAKAFALLAAVENHEKGVDEDIRAGLSDEDPSVVACAIEVIALRKDQAAIEELVQLADRAEDEKTLTLVLDTVGQVLGNDAAWDEKLRAWAAAPAASVRNAALEQLAARQGKAAQDLFVENLEHADWSTRLAALQALVSLREASVIGPVIARMAKEEGRMLLEFADALWSLTGQSFGMRPESWKAWWEREAATFQVVDPDVLAKNRGALEAWRLKQTTYIGTPDSATGGPGEERPSFFGLRILTHRVIFVLDVSGSMAFDLRAEYEGEKPEPRMAVAGRELLRCIDALEEGALFNIITFSAGVESWLDGGIAASSGKTREEARTYISRLGAFGATNMFDALDLAFDDPEVDTIYLLSDGLPTAGAITDPFQIRQEIERMNEHRGIVIHTVAVGGTLQILEWLAEDSGGSHVKFQ